MQQQRPSAAKEKYYQETPNQASVAHEPARHFPTPDLVIWPGFSGQPHSPGHRFGNGAERSSLSSASFLSCPEL